MSNDIQICNNSFSCDNFERLLCDYLRMNPKTVEIEKEGLAIISEKNLENRDNWDKLKAFITNVHHWGGGLGNRNLQTVINYGHQALAERFQGAINNLRSDKPDVRQAIEVITQVFGLGIAFGSKHLRFLAPDLCPVLDRILSEKCGYCLNAEDYQKFSNKCSDIARQLNKQKVCNPFPGRNTTWYPCDVEAALYGHFQN